MARKPQTTDELDREAYLVRELRTISGIIKDARAKGYATLLTRMLLRQDDLQAELVERRQKAADELAKSSRTRPADMSDEEWMAQVANDAASCTEEDLDVYMREWATRRKYLVAVEAGELRLVRRAS